MRQKRILYTLFLALITNVSLYATLVEGQTEEVEIDFNTNTLTAKDGMVLRQGNNKTKVTTLQRDEKTGKAFYRDGIIFESETGSGKLKIESESGDGDNANKEANFYKNFGYLEVGAVTGAEAPNDRIYFGSEHIAYQGEKVHAYDAWLTTDFKVINHAKNPKEIDYHIATKEVVIEPEKQLTVYDANLYLKTRKSFPFAFPWFRMNIRQGSKVALFPHWGEKEYYGWQMTWGFLYGDRNAKLRGGIAPKFADDMGWLIGRWETWYDTKKYGETQVNVDDLLVFSKVEKEKEKTNPIAYEQRHKRYQVEAKHDYSGEYGEFHLIGRNSTLSMVSSYNDLITKYAANNEFSNTKGIRGTGLFLERPKFDRNIGFYTATSDLQGMGQNKDISLTADVKLTTDKKLHTLNLYDDVENNAFGTERDNALYANVGLYKDNPRYKIGGYYHYLYDVTPGYNRKYMRSKGEDYGFVALDKEYRLGLQYDEKEGDKLRALGIWELESDARDLKSRNLLSLPIDYTPLAVSEYAKYNERKGRLFLGDYQLGKYRVHPDIFLSQSEKKLDDLTNEKIVIRDNSVAHPDSYHRKNGYDRFREYNRFQNEVYEKKREVKLNTRIFEEGNLSLDMYGGRQKEEYQVRDGEISGDISSYTPIRSQSSFYGFDLKKENIHLEDYGRLQLQGGLRFDDYQVKEGNSWRWNLGATHDVTLLEAETGKLTNTLDLSLSKYHYSGEDRKARFHNLYSKKDSYAIKDSLVWKGSNLDASYQGAYRVDKNPLHTSDKKAQWWKQDIRFDWKENRKLDLFYEKDERYTNRAVTQEASYRDLDKQNFGGSLSYGAHKMSYQRQEIDFGAKEKARENIDVDNYRYSYSWEDKELAFRYGQGKDRIFIDDFHNPQVLNIKNQVYGLQFHKRGEVEHHIHLNYENARHLEESSKVNLNGERKNIGHTDKLNFSYQYKDKRYGQADYIRYAALESGKAQEELTMKDIERARRILAPKESLDDKFQLQGIREDAFLFGDERVNFRFYTSLERNKARYAQTHDFTDSLQQIKGAMYYSYNRYGIGYKFEENVGWLYQNGAYQWKKKNREHQISLYGKVGEPSRSWKVKTYAKFYENLLDKVNADHKNKRALDGIGVEIGKEFDFYEWSVLYERRYSLAARDYEWRVGLQFTLLTFPDNSLFSLGRERKTKNKRLKTQFLESMKIEDIVDDELETKNIMKK